MENNAFITTRQGIYQGERTENCLIFRGIPYAKAPVGELRFCPPEPPETFTGVRQALRFGPRSVQADGEPDSFYGKEFYAYPNFPAPEISEDCLYLNLWIPAGTPPADGWPIVLWIHGGGFIGGWGSEIEFDGTAWAKRGVVLVTCNYRLGLLGYFAHPELSAEQDGHSGNYGLLDQIAALSWVYENAKAFSGNPQCITLMGQSAGAVSVQAMLCSPLCRSIPAGAIIQSAISYRNGFVSLFTLQEMETLFEKLLKAENMTVKELRTLPVEEILRLQNQWMAGAASLVGERGLTPFAVSLADGDALPVESFELAVDSGEMAKIPILTGVTKDDIFVSEEGRTNPDTAPSYQDMLSFAARRKAEGGEACYAYYFRRELPGDNAGAFHSGELWYEFGTLESCWRPFTDADVALSENILDTWTSFAKTGTPGGEWTSCDGTNATVMSLDI